jgi:ABC-type molybdenum transport system ATPase subunit/photorepair protein PhrA
VSEPGRRRAAAPGTQPTSGVSITPDFRLVLGEKASTRATWTCGPSTTEVRGAAHEATAPTRRRPPAVAVEDVHKSYGDLKAVDEGEFFDILGPNGAGKTTTPEIVEGLREPDSGNGDAAGETPWPRDPRLLPRIGMLDVRVRGKGVEELIVSSAVLIGFTLVIGFIASRVFRWED